MDEADSLAFACAHSYVTNKLDYCGKTGSHTAFLDYLQHPAEEKREKITKLLSSFYGLSAYLELIAESNNKDWLDFAVLEAYWLGNSLLEKVSRRDYQKTILSLQQFGLPGDIAERKSQNLPECLLPHHSAHVLYVNFITKKLEPVQKNLSDCLIQWAKVEGQKFDGRIIAKGIELVLQNNSLALKEKKKILSNPFNLRVEKKDFVSVHWGNAVALLREGQLSNLKRFTIQNIGAINSSKSANPKA